MLVSTIGEHRLVPPSGIEPLTFPLPMDCTATVLRRRRPIVQRRPVVRRWWRTALYSKQTPLGAHRLAGVSGNLTAFTVHSGGGVVVSISTPFLVPSVFKTVPGAALVTPPKGIVWYLQSDSNGHCTRSERAPSTNWGTQANCWCTREDSNLHYTTSQAVDSTCWPTCAHNDWCGRGDLNSHVLMHVSL